MKNNTITIVILLAAAGLGYYFYMKKKKNDAAAAAAAAAKKPKLPTVTPQTGQGQTGGTVINQGGAGLGTPGAPAPGTGSGVLSPGKYSFSEAELTTLLNRGKTGTNVKALQIYLKKAGQNIGASGADGIFGTDTEAALRNEEGTASTTLKSLNITGVDTITNNVFGRAFGWSPEGIWN